MKKINVKKDDKNIIIERSCILKFYFELFGGFIINFIIYT